MNPSQRRRFDTLLESALESMSPRLRALLEEVPLIVDDRPEPSLAKELYEELGHEPDETLKDFVDFLCGLHTGLALTERSVEHSAGLPDHIRIFRDGIVNVAGGWHLQPGEDPESVDNAIYQEIVITILHEIGHHFGLSEHQLEELGYG